jgi:hypothetical protein
MIRFLLSEKVNPLVLYHGSYYLTDTLKPGIDHTKAEIQWDETESNKFLYASAGRQLAAEMGFASSLTQIGLEVRRFKTEKGIMTIEGYSPISTTDIERVKQFYVYCIAPDRFIPVNNKFNNAVDEYKTDQHIPKREIIRVETIDAKAFLGQYTLELK